MLLLRLSDLGMHWPHHVTVEPVLEFPLSPISVTREESKVVNMKTKLKFGSRNSMVSTQAGGHTQMQVQ